MSSSSEDESLNPGGAASDAKIAMLNLPSKSRRGYIQKYVNFMKWKKLHGVKSFSEEVFLDYFKELAKAKLPSTLWAVYSMLKATLSAKKNIHIAKYSNLTAFIKQQSRGYISQKSRVFTASEVETFLKEAPDHIYLAMKVALIFGINGSCQIIEMINIRVADIQKHSDQMLIVNIMASPSKQARSFMILNKDVEIVEKYLALRPKNMKTDRFFIRYNLGKCRHQVIGRNNIQKYPRRIAEYLKLPNPEKYTGHCFRKTTLRLSTTSDLMEFRRKSEQSALTQARG
ncbi:uncharacterized protein [Choristoneura fumiferana]|uniref:uncharacterized protein n=1 Tax=Choristoneura fumiferana TaxID=7141 RepID=UPI003D155FEB